MTFSQFLEAALRPHVLVARSLYAPPQPSFMDATFLWLTRENGPAPILGDVSVAAWDERGLAAGLGDGQIRVFSDWPCRGVPRPGRAPVGRLSWSPASPWLAACGQDEATARIFDLRQCGEVAALPAGGKILALAASSAGARLALVDEARRLRLGPLGGPLETVASLRFEPLDLGFTPQDGGLLAVDAGGWITFWNADQKRLTAAFLVPGGPFVAARLAGRTVSLTNGAGETVVWDVAVRQPVSDEVKSPLFLANGVLYVRGEVRRWVKQVVLRAPTLTAAWSARLGLLRVRDLDGQTRYYDLTRGEPAPAPAPVSASTPAAGPAGESAPEDWTPVQLDGEAAVQIQGVRYQLADPVFRSGDDLLLCRSGPDGGFFLWWRKVPGQPLEPRVGELPVRRSVRADAPVDWLALSTSAKAY